MSVTSAAAPVPSSAPAPLAAEVVRGYHGRTKHRFEAYAAGPGTLDWDAQPAPFRHFDGAPRTVLPLASIGGLFGLLVAGTSCLTALAAGGSGVGGGMLAIDRERTMRLTIGVLPISSSTLLKWGMAGIRGD